MRYMILFTVAVGSVPCAGLVLSSQRPESDATGPLCLRQAFKAHRASGQVSRPGRAQAPLLPLGPDRLTSQRLRTVAGWLSSRTFQSPLGSSAFSLKHLIGQSESTSFLSSGARAGLVTMKIVVRMEKRIVVHSGRRRWGASWGSGAADAGARDAVPRCTCNKGVWETQGVTASLWSHLRQPVRT